MIFNTLYTMTNFCPNISYKGQRLTEKQVKTLSLIAQGYSNNEIANNLQISKRTLEHHLRAIRLIIQSKDGFNPNDRQLVIFAKEMFDGYQIYMVKKREESPIIIDDWEDDEEKDLCDIDNFSSEEHYVSVLQGKIQNL